MPYLMGIDVATTALKTLIIADTGEIVAEAAQEYPMETPAVGWAEQHPQLWWQAAIHTINQAISKANIKPEEIKGIGLTGQMHGLVILDERNEVLRPCIMWCDQRTDRQCQWITDRVGKNTIEQITLNPVLTGFTAPKIIWVRDNEPEIYKKIKHIMLPKDYIRFKLTGEYAIDVADASGTSLLDVKERCWSAEILNKLEIPIEWLPKVYESQAVCGEVSKEAAKVCGLKAGTPTVAGAGDQAAGGVGNGVVRPAVISSTIGTSGVVFAYLEAPATDIELRTHTFCHAVPNKWHVMGVTLAAGGSFRWFRDTLCSYEKEAAKLAGIDTYELLTSMAAQAPAGCEGLLFLPYMIGERTPYPDPYAKGVFFGLSLRHTKPYLIRAVMEGVAFSLRDCLEIIKSMGVEIKEVRASGGGARSALWRQIQADINNSELVLTNIIEAPAFGAALLAGVGVRIYNSIEEACDTTIKIIARTYPNPQDVELYENYYQIYKALYPTLKAHFAEVSKLIAF